MRDHVRILGYLNIAMGALGLIGALVIAIAFGGAAGIVRMAAPQEPDAMRVAVPIIGIVVTAIFVFLIAISLSGIVAGAGLLHFRPWARILTIVLSALNLLNVPLGAALGVYGLWVLLQAQTWRLFANPQSAACG